MLFTSAHEAGLFGSENFVKQYPVDSLKIKAVLNFDLVGRLDDSRKMLRINNNQKDTEVNNYFKNNKDAVLNPVAGRSTSVHNTDLRHFEKFNLPLINVTTRNT